MTSDTPTAVSAVSDRASALSALSPLDYRRDTYDEAWHEIGEDPLTGKGSGGFRVASDRPGSPIRGIRPDHAYNLVLTWGAETGVVGVGLILAFAAALALAAREAGRLARARNDMRDRALVAGVAGGLIALFVHGAVDYTPRNPIIWYAGWTLVGALLVCRREQRRLRVALPAREELA